MRHVALISLALAAACGSEPRAKDPPRAESRAPALAVETESGAEESPGNHPHPTAARPRRAPADAPTVLGETGGLDPDAVARVLEGRERAIDRCWDQALARQPWFTGAVRLRVRVGPAGRAEAVTVARSSSGDRAFERCLADTLAEPAWPRPVGGKSGVVEQDYSFPPPDGAPTAAAWSTDEIARTEPSLRGELGRCAGGHAITVTAWIGAVTVDPADAGAFSGLVDAGDAGDAAPFEIGVARAAGVAAPEGTPEAALDCAHAAALRVAWPSPGSGVAKAALGP